jgi:hypothetical protein
MGNRVGEIAADALAVYAVFALALAVWNWDARKARERRLASEAARLVVDDLDRQARLQHEAETARRLLEGVL